MSFTANWVSLILFTLNVSRFLNRSIDEANIFNEIVQELENEQGNNLVEDVIDIQQFVWQQLKEWNNDEISSDDEEDKNHIKCMEMMEGLKRQR